MLFFFFNDTATTEIYPLSLHDALPIYARSSFTGSRDFARSIPMEVPRPPLSLMMTAWSSGGSPGGSSSASGSSVTGPDRKSTRLNSTHANISYAVFCFEQQNRRGRLVG